MVSLSITKMTEVLEFLRVASSKVINKQTRTQGEHINPFAMWVDGP